MYSEKQYFRHRYARWLQWLCAAVAATQLVMLIAAEAGQPWLLMPYAVQVGVLLTAGLVFGLLSQAALTLHIGEQRVSLRYFPYQLRFQHLRWEEIRQLRLLPAGECPAGLPFGFPGRDFTRAYWLSTPFYRILQITLMNGTQLYITTAQPNALLDFLQHGLYLRGMKVGMLQ